MIRRKTFNDAKVAGKWLVIVDGTELDEGLQKKNDKLHHFAQNISLHFVLSNTQIAFYYIH